MLKHRWLSCWVLSPLRLLTEEYYLNSGWFFWIFQTKALKELGAVFRGAVFRGAVFIGAVFRGAVFIGAVFRGAVFRGAVFRGAVFRGPARDFI